MDVKHTQKKLFLIDASSLIFRAFFAIHKLSTASGIPTNATYGFTTMLLNVLEKYHPDYIACIFDTPKPTFRKEMYPEYKSNRGAPPDELIPQFEHIHRVVKALGITTLSQPGFEADDLIATLVKKFKELEVIIVTGDKDLMQLVDDQVKTLDTMKGILYGPKEVEEKLGIAPEFVTDYLGLIGDSSDNIPGIPGIGPKTAVELIREYGCLENILKAIPKMKEGKRRDLLNEHAKIALLSKQLATVHVDVQKCKDITAQDLETPTEKSEEFLNFLKEMEFHSLEKKYQKSVEVLITREMPKVTKIETEEHYKKCLEHLSSIPVIAFDVTVTGSKTTELLATELILSGHGTECFQVILPDKSKKDFFKNFEHFLKNKTIVTHDIKQSYKALLNEGIELKTTFFDTMLAHYLLDPEEKHGLDVLSARFLNAPIHGEFLSPLERAPLNFKLHEILHSELKKQNLEKLFFEIEIPVAPVIAHMEYNGIMVDSKILEKLSHEYSVELKKIEHDIFKIIGHPFNLNSPKQLSEVLFGKLSLPVIQKTKTGFSTDAAVLEKLAPLHPVPAMIVRYRELTKLKTTYVDVLPELIESDGRIHAKFNQAVAATGRLSSSDPNLQNIPVKTESGRKIREAFAAAQGCSLVGVDYSQIELRLIAHLSGDEALVEAFKTNQDIHTLTAAEIFHVKHEQVTNAQRNAAKAINFGLIYGKTAFGLSQELNISRHEASQYIDSYFKKYRGVKIFMDRCLEDARKHGVSTTFFGRKRPIRDINNKNVGVRNNAERMALNAPVQGTAADLMKIAMIQAQKSCTKLGAKLVLQVHDELVMEVPKSVAQKAEQSLKYDMEHVTQFSVPIQTHSAVASNWMEL